MTNSSVVVVVVVVAAAVVADIGIAIFCVLASLKEGLSVRPSVGPLVGW